MYPNVMKLLELKKILLSACLDEIDEKTASLQKAMDDAQQSANDYGQPKDRYDSYRAQLLRKRDMLGQQLQKLLQQRDVLERLDPEKISTSVGFGSVVITDKQKIFVSIGLGKKIINGEEYFIISGGVPFYKSIEGKMAGEDFEFRGQKYRILEIA
jgi:hypothetical protein